GTFTLTAANGELTGGAPSDSVNTVTVSSDGTFATWSSTLSMDAVFIKGGNEGGNLYVYDPESTGPDSGLATPSEQGISHIEFCYDYELSASKTANAEYTRTYTWEIFKSVDPDAHTGFFGDEFSSDYEVEVDQTVVDSDYKVTGEITIDNPTPFAVSFRVIDAVGGAPATVNCPSTDLAPGGQVVCSYSADLGGPVDGMNVATIFSGSPSVDGATAQAPYAFGDPTTVNGFETINVTDYFDGDLAGDDLGSASGDYTFTYSRDFECPVDEAEYTDGVFTDAFPNEAEIDETGQSDDANVDLTCYKPVVSKDAETEWYREYTWEISKSVDPDAHTGFAGDIFGSDYEVFVDQTVADYGYRAFGSIEVTNPAGVEIDVNVADAVDGVDASVDCGDGTGSLTVAAGATASCDYTVGLSDNTDRTNTATVSFNGYDFEATADVDFGAPIIVGFPEINVTDYFDGDLAGDDLGSADGDFTFEYSRDFECPIDEAEYTDGVFTDAFPNEAEIDETGQSDDANVDLTCYIPASARVVKTTTEGGEDIGQFPFTFELYDPGDVLVESKGLNGAGEVVFDAELEDEGTWTVVEVLPDGWVSTTATECTFDVAFPGSADETYSCSFDNVEMSRLDLVKLTNGQPTTVQTWTFDLYEGPDGFGGTLVASDATPPALLDFGDSDLDPFATYTLCEREVPAGYSTFWQIDTDGDSIGDVTVLPYNPNADDDPPEDLGNRCVDVGAGTGIDLVPGTTLHFIVDNQQPGGAPRTPGYWKNWNMCTGGNQQFTAASNGGWEEGFWLLEDVLDPSIGGGIVWDDIQADTFEFPIEACEVAVDILDKREVGDPAIVGDGKKAANDPLHNLATHLLAAQLNFGAGACTTQEALDAALAAETLLDQYNFDGDGHDPLPKKSDDAALANELAGILDAYNNGEFCGDGVD
ncbi:MAG: hypothetical protein PVF47_17625, partial [Anaerolineae bacterium]